MSPRHLRLPLLALCLCAAVSAHAQSAEPGDELRLHPGDGLRVVVNDEPALSGDYPVDLDGFVLLPMVGRVQVSDRPFSTVRSELHATYADALVQPLVQLTPLLRVSVLGEVRQPGLFSVDPTHTFSDLLALAGGLTPQADRRRITLVRGGRSVEAALEPGGGGVPVRLRSGDQVFVGRRSWTSEYAGILIGSAASVAAAAVTSLLIR